MQIQKISKNKKVIFLYQLFSKRDLNSENVAKIGQKCQKLTKNAKN
jgi:hypothetical protein